MASWGAGHCCSPPSPLVPATHPGEQEIWAQLPPAWPRDAPAHAGLSLPAQEHGLFTASSICMVESRVSQHLISRESCLLHFGRQRPTFGKWDSVSHSIPHCPAVTPSLHRAGTGGKGACPIPGTLMKRWLQGSGSRKLEAAGAGHGNAEAACRELRAQRAGTGRTKKALPWSH